jgi:hypothetical protein
MNGRAKKRANSAEKRRFPLLRSSKRIILEVAPEWHADQSD